MEKKQQKGWGERERGREREERDVLFLHLLLLTTTIHAIHTDRFSIRVANICSSYTGMGLAEKLS